MRVRAGEAQKKTEVKENHKHPVFDKAGLTETYTYQEQSPVDRILHLQQTIGNRAVSRLIQSGAIQAKLRTGQPGDIYEQEADRAAEQVMRKSSAAGLRITAGAQGLLQLKPSAVTAYTFLDLPVSGGLNPTMQARLNAVAAHLRTRYTAVNGTAPANDQAVRVWAGVNTMLGWRRGSATSRSKHCSGSAVDVNYSEQPYIVTRTTTGGGTTVYGGERAGSHLTAQRVAAVEVFDRAMDFVYGGRTADVSARRQASGTTPRETTSAVYQRFSNVSEALAIYLSLAFHTTHTDVRRRPIANIETAPEADLLAAIPTTERKDEAVGITDITNYINGHLASPGNTNPMFHFTAAHAANARDYYYRMLRDYEHVRIPFVMGNPSARPARTRNPARGFLHMTEEFVVAMCDVGNLRWGISDLGTAESGDTHHFDLGNHGGITPDCTP